MDIKKSQLMKTIQVLKGKEPSSNSPSQLKQTIESLKKKPK